MLRDCFLFLLCGIAVAAAQITSSLSGTVKDPSGAVIIGARVSAKNHETNMVYMGQTDERGRFHFSSLPVGPYGVQVSARGFQEQRREVQTAIGQEAVIDVVLHVGATETIQIIESPPIVPLTTQDPSGLVNERQVKNLPLNGRSYDLLLPLNPGVVNFTSQKTGGVGGSNSTTGNNFAVSGNRPQQNLFLLNGIEFTGAAENNMQPGGASQELLGVDGVREFNVLRDTYGAEYGKRPGAQVLIETQAGTNAWHGSAFEFLRNNALDAPNYFDQGSAPPFRRNQFGAALGGPLRLNQTFFFVNYEGLRQSLNQTAATFVPDLASRAAAAPSVRPLLNLWPTPPATAPDFNGIAEIFTSPLQTIREDFGTARFDQDFSERDRLKVVYTLDDGHDVTATGFDPYSTDILNLREQVASVEQSHSFSAYILNIARFGFSRAGYFYTGEPTPGTAAASVPGFLLGKPVGAVVVGGSAASNPQAQLGLAGSNNGSNLHIARNLFTVEDSVAIVKGNHVITAGGWVQRLQSNELLALSQYGQATFSSLQSFLQGTVGTFLYDPAPTPLNWRALFSAGYVQDDFRATRNLDLTFGLRLESTTGWNEAHGRAANYTFSNGVISSQPHIGATGFTVNNGRFLPQPRIGVAWSPFGGKTVVRAGFGIYNDLQDALGYRADQNAPFNPTYTLASLPVSQLPLDPRAPVPAAARLVAGGVQPDLKPPTLISWSLRIQRELSPNAAFTIGYVGSHSYHELIGLDANEPAPVICPAAPCPATFPANFPAPLAGMPVPKGTHYIPAGTPKANPTLANTWTWFALGVSSYHALQLDFNRRFAHGFAVRAAYTWSKALDDGDSLNATTAGNAPGLVADPFNLKADWGPATYDVRHAVTISAVYELPFGKGKRFATMLPRPANAIMSGWTVNSIFAAQTGFPFTPQLSYNPSNNGDTRNPVRPFANPNFRGRVILGRPDQWFNPNAFLQPPPNSGFYGNLGRDTLTGPGLATWDVALHKLVPLREGLNAQFRAEMFNLLNRANFNTPNLIVFTPSALSGSAGAVTSTSTSSRQVQLGVKLLW